MRVSREKAQENREQIIETAARLLRQRGFDGIGVADIMKAAGLTHGGFYRNFASKDDLAVKASERAIADTKALLKDGLAQQPKDPLRTLIERYVSAAHRDDPGSGCILPALAADAARCDDPALRAVFVTAIQFYLDQIAKLIVRDPKSHRQQTSRCHPLGDGWRCHIVSGDCGYPSGGIADCRRGGGYCRTIPGKQIGRGVMQRGSRKALASSCHRRFGHL